MGFFKKEAPRIIPTGPVEYPAGVCLKTERGTYLLNKDGKRYRILTDAILQSWSFPLTVETSEAAVSKYPVAVTKLGFRDGTLLNNIADAKLYLVSESKLRHITSPVVLDRLGVSRKDAVLVSDAEIKLMKQGEEIY